MIKEIHDGDYFGIGNGCLKRIKENYKRIQNQNRGGVREC